LVKNIRDSLGGNVLERSVQHALNELPTDSFGLFEIGQAEGKTHFKFTNNLLFEILLAGVEPDKKLEELQRSLRAVAKLMKVCQLTGILGGWSVRGVRHVGRCFTPLASSSTI